MEGTMKKIEDGLGFVTMATETFGGLGNSTAKIAALIVEIATASKDAVHEYSSSHYCHEQY